MNAAGWLRVLGVASVLGCAGAPPDATPAGDYAFVPTAGGFRAESLAQGFRVELGADRIELTSSSGNFTFHAGPSRAGCEGALARVEPATPEAEGSRAMYRRPGFDEWYVNGPSGLEQGFTLAAPFPCRDSDTPVVIELRISGLEASVADDGKEAALRDRTGRIALRYGGLRVTDATGRELSSSLSAGAGSLAVRFDAEGAEYPVTVDPWLWSQEAKLPVTDGASGDGLGHSVALDGDTAVVGAPLKPPAGQGMAYVFERSGQSWSQVAALTAADAGANDGLGKSVAVNGDTILVGAPGWCMGASRGAVYVFERSGSTWSQRASLAAGDGVSGDRFGSAVAIDGETALVGAPGKASGRGAAYVFIRSGPYWTQEAEFWPAGGTASDGFGRAVALDGETAVVGASGGGATHTGTAYVYVRSGSSWTQQALLTANDGAAYDMFGDSVAIAGDTAIVGASGKALGMGVAYVFTQSGASWVQQQKLATSNGAAGDGLGKAAALDGDTAVLGAPAKSWNRGSAYVFARSGALWAQQADLTAADGQTLDWFGGAVALRGDTAVVGAPWKASYAGAAYVLVLAGVPCSSGADCQTGFCVDGVCCAVPACPMATDGCHLDGVCQAGTGQCTNAVKPEGSPCDDSNACTTVDVCVGGACTGTGPKACPPAPDSCHEAGVCDPATGGCSNPAKADGVLCDDGNGCTQTDTCMNGACVGGQPKACAPMDSCHEAGACDPQTGSCDNPSKPDGSCCDDGSACTSCDACQAGVCVGTATVCPAPGPCHLAGSCDPSSGLCDNPVKPDGTACSDGDACTQAEVCVAGVCVGVQAVCPAPDACHEPGVCDTTTGECSNVASPDGSPCNGDDLCLVGGTCQSGVCAGGSLIACTAEDECHDIGTCDSLTGACDSPVKPDGTPCSVGACRLGVCVPVDAGTGSGGGGGTGGGVSTSTGGTGGTPDTGSSGGGGATGGSGSGGTSTASTPTKTSGTGCGCAVPGAEGSLRGGWVGLVAILVARLRRRRR